MNKRKFKRDNTIREKDIRMACVYSKQVAEQTGDMARVIEFTKAYIQNHRIYLAVDLSEKDGVFVCVLKGFKRHLLKYAENFRKANELAGWNVELQTNLDEQIS